MIDELEQLRKEYAAEMPNRMTSIHHGMDVIIQALTHQNKCDWHPLNACVHKLAGSSGSYGFKELSKAARYMEDLIESGKLTTQSPQNIIAHLSRWYDVLSRCSHTVQSGAQNADINSAIQDLAEHFASLSEQNTKKAA